MSNILITGASGFIGSRLCEILLQNNNNVKAVTRNKLLSGNFIESENFSNIVIKDINGSTQWEEQLANIDCVIHLAARVHIMNDLSDDPIKKYRDLNTLSTINLARQAVKAGVKRFIYLSTIKVNGEYTLVNTPFKASDHANPSDPYALSKLEAEKSLLALSSKEKIEVVIIRPPLVYGPGVKANFLSMMSWVNRGVPLPLGLIQNKRSLVALDNLVNLIEVCILHKEAANEVFLVSDDEDLSISELLSKIAKALDKPNRLLPIPLILIKLIFNVLGKKDLSRRLLGSLQVDINKTKNILNWKPIVSIDQALKNTTDFFLESKN